MKIASLVYATEQGLGYLAKDFHDNGLINVPVIIKHRHRVNHPEWYESGLMVDDARAGAVRNRLLGSDVVLFFETPFDWSLIPWCRQRGIKTVLMPMHECMPKVWPYQPDLIVNPSHLDQRVFPGGKHIPVPVPRSIQWRQRDKAITFVHNAGHGGLKGRNGTKEVLEALQYVKSPIRLLVRSQDQDTSHHGNPFGNSGITVQHAGSLGWNELYDEGDVFLFPEQFNGLSLPVQEAFASGMLVMAGARFPMTEWLPTSPLIKVDRYTVDRISSAYTAFDRAHYSPQEIAATIDRWYGKDITEYSYLGREWAVQNSWDVLKPVYVKTLTELLNKDAT